MSSHEIPALPYLGSDESEPFRNRVAWDVAGFLIFCGLVAWCLIAASASGGNAVPAIQLIVGSWVVLVLARVLAYLEPSLVPAFVIAATAAVAIAYPSVLSDRPLSGPFGYSNATAAFFMQAATAGAMLWVGGRRAVHRSFGLGTFVVMVGAGIATGSRLAVLCGALLLVIVFLRDRGARIFVAIAAVSFAVTLAGTIFAGAGGIGSNVATGITGTERRVELWGDAFVLMGSKPVTGIGFGRFATESPTARNDDDARHAHNGYLQLGAEAGIPAMMLLIAVFAWAFARLYLVSSRDTIAAAAAGGVACLGIHASIDYVLHFPAVVVAACALVGSGMTVREEA